MANSEYMIRISYVDDTPSEEFFKEYEGINGVICAYAVDTQEKIIIISNPEIATFLKLKYQNHSSCRVINIG